MRIIYFEGCKGCKYKECTQVFAVHFRGLKARTEDPSYFVLNIDGPVRFVLKLRRALRRRRRR